MTEPIPGPWWVTKWAAFLSGDTLFDNVSRLSTGAMLIAAHGSEHLHSRDDIQHELDRLNTAIDRFALISSSPQASLARLVDICTNESGKRDITGFGFIGDQVNYHDPRNSFMPDIFRRRTGLPIGLAVMWMHVAERIGLSAFGVGMPGHFLIGVATPHGDTYVDCFAGGQLLSADDCQTLYDRLFGGRPHAPFHPEYLSAVSDDAIFTRMIANLKQHAARRRDLTTLTDLARLRWFLPMASLDEGRELVRLCVALGAAGEADYWLEQVQQRFAALYPEAQQSADRTIVQASHN
jgi:regulator of sirC expression with transglutaminase-like and TPR domain